MYSLLIKAVLKSNLKAEESYVENVRDDSICLVPAGRAFVVALTLS